MSTNKFLSELLNAITGISFFIPTTAYKLMGRDSVVGIATRYGLDVSGIESRWGRDFPH